MQTLMKIERVVFACILLVAGSFVAMNALGDKPIYKSIDADGNVVFTDVPPSAQQSAETVDLVAPNSFNPQEAGANGGQDRELWVVDPDADGEDESALPYSSLTIESPGNDSHIRDNSGNFTVTASVVPPLHPGHSMRLLVDDIPAASAGRDAIFALTGVDRGTHTLKAEVLDDSGAVIFTGNPSIVHLQQYSKLTAPNRPVPAPTGGN